jgi:hypothetical protein
VDKLDYIDILKKFYNAGKLLDHELNEIRSFLIDKSPQIVNAIENDILKIHLRYSPSTPNRSINYNEFKTILSQQKVSPTPVVNSNESIFQDIASNTEIAELNQKFISFKEEMHDKYNKMKGQTENDFKNLESDLKRKFSTLEDDLKSRTEENLFRVVHFL